MLRMSLRMTSAAFGLCVAVAATAPADTIYATNDPFGGWFGINGFDVFEHQSVATRFTPGAAHTIDGFSVWLWNNDESGGEPQITFTLRPDDNTNGESRPSSTILETWTMSVPNTGLFNPVEFFFVSQSHTPLSAGQRYWIAAESQAAALADPVWAWAANDSGVTTNTDYFTGEWYPAPEQGAVATLIVTGTPAGGLAGDVNGDGHVDLADLALLLATFGQCQGDPAYNAAADFDASGCVELGDLTVLLANFGV
ncbi:MAG: hypothetical protein HZB38_00670 [Planctomycetes bacterium]|nr:hypothetical protein [Planctomycetota bacterium]